MLFEEDRNGQVVEALVDRNRTRLDVKRLRTILGRKNRPHHRKNKTAHWQVTVERPAYDLTILKIHCGKVALNIYTKGERVLRAEAMVSDTRELRCGRDIGQFATAATKLKDILERFLEALSCVDQCLVSGDVLLDLAAPTKIGETRVSGIDINSSRMRKVARGLLALSVMPDGFTSSQVAKRIREQGGGGSASYGPRQASYDLPKLQANGFVARSRGSRRYRMIPEGLRKISALVLLRDQVLAPLLVSASTKIQPLGGATLLDRLHVVRFGIRRPDDPLIVNSVKVVDEILAVNFTPDGSEPRICFHRYNHDGYRQKENGQPWKNYPGDSGDGIGGPYLRESVLITRSPWEATRGSICDRLNHLPRKRVYSQSRSGISLLE